MEPDGVQPPAIPVTERVRAIHNGKCAVWSGVGSTGRVVLLDDYRVAGHGHGGRIHGDFDWPAVRVADVAAALKLPLPWLCWQVEDLALLLEQAGKAVCDAQCPSVWFSDAERLHCKLCERIRSKLTCLRNTPHTPQAPFVGPWDPAPQEASDGS